MSLTRLCVAGSVAAIVLALGIASCSRESATEPETSRLQPTVHPSYNQGVDDDSDLCAPTGEYPDCHNDDLSYVDPDNDASCPTGCHTFAFDSSEEVSWNAAMALIPNNEACGWAITYLQQMMLHGRVRVYFQADSNNADTHPSEAPSATTPDWMAAIHIYSGRIEYGTPQQLANTMVHEAWHGYFNSGDEVAAQGEADACLGGGYP